MNHRWVIFTAVLTASTASLSGCLIGSLLHTSHDITELRLASVTRSGLSEDRSFQTRRLSTNELLCIDGLVGIDEVDVLGKRPALEIEFAYVSDIITFAPLLGYWDFSISELLLYLHNTSDVPVSVSIHEITTPFGALAHEEAAICMWICGVYGETRARDSALVIESGQSGVLSVSTRGVEPADLSVTFGISTATRARETFTISYEIAQTARHGGTRNFLRRP
jgi:hypothetical protein